MNVGSRTARAKSVWVCHRERAWESSETAETRSSHCLFSLVWVYFLRERFENSFSRSNFVCQNFTERWQKWQNKSPPNQKKEGQERSCGEAAVLEPLKGDVLAVHSVVRVLCNICDRWAIEWGTQERSRKVASDGLPWVLLYEVKGRAASPVTWFIRRLLVILGPPPSLPHPPPPPPPHLPRTLRADSKHCNLQYFSSFRIKKPHFATWWNLRKYQCFC